jgi:hypothetical protein
VAKPLCPKGNNGFRGERAGVENDSEKSQRSERTGLKEAARENKKMEGR